FRACGQASCLADGGCARNFPGARAVVPRRSLAPLQVKALKEAAPSLGVALQIQDIQSGDDLPAAFDAGAREHAEALLTTGESMFVVHRARVSELAARYRLPAMYPYLIQVIDGGGLMAYDASYPDLI